MNRKWITTLALLVFAMMAAAPANAQGFAKKPGQPQPPMMDDESRDKLERRVEQMIVWELSEVMQLSPDKDEKFFNVMRDHFKAKRELTAKQFESMKLLQELYQNKSATDAEFRNALDDLESQYEKQLELELELHQDLKRVLTAREQARFVLEWPKVQNKVRDTIMQRKQDMDRGPEQRGKGMKNPK